MAGSFDIRRISTSRCVRDHTAGCTATPTAEAGDGARAAVLVKCNLGHGILEMGRFGVGLGAGPSGAEAINKN